MAEPREFDLAALIAGCATEPIHAPGGVQPHGALLATDQRGTIRAASESCEAILGVRAADAVGIALVDVVGAEASGQFADAEDGDLVSIALPAGACEAVIHRGTPLDLIEIERAPSTAVDDQARLQRALLRFHGAADSTALLAQAAAIVQDLTGFDRVMVYRFDREWNGEVVAEVVRPDLEPFLGLRYPASDIPPQARALYSRMRLRLISDATAAPSPLLADGETSGRALDLSDVSIRAVSPVHLQYLTNMGVRSSMSAAIQLGGQLWGLIACHHVTEPLDPPIRTRNAVDLVGRTTSTVLAALLASESAATQLGLLARLDALTDPLRLEGAVDPVEALVAEASGLAALLDADGAAVVTGASVLLTGSCPSRALVLDLVAHAAGTEAFASEHLAEINESWANQAEVAAGAVAVRVGSGDRWLVWFRAETAAVIRWGGDPDGKETSVGLRGQLHLTPRASFAEYLEEVRGTCVPWSREQVAVAQLAADRLASLDAVKAQRDARVALEVQRAVMIEAFPPIPGIDGAARYQPSAQDPIGGDWYDVFFRPQGGPVIALGDVAGHGLSAAATMAQLRHALRAYVIREDTPAEAMSRLNDLLLTLLAKEMATAMIVTLDLATHSADIVNAGHLPAVVVGPAGAHLIEDSRHDPALGIIRQARYTPTRIHLPPDHTLVLFTDGLIERRSATIDDRLAALVDAAAAGAHLSPADLCDHLVEALGGNSDVGDDTTVLALRFDGR